MEELDVGSRAAEFELGASTGGVVSLAEYRGKTNVILFFVREYG
jgi:peroxiredoxin